MFVCFSESSKLSVPIQKSKDVGYPQSSLCLLVHIYIYICIYTVEHGQLEYDPYELMALDWVPDKSIQSEILPGENAVRI